MNDATSIIEALKAGAFTSKQLFDETLEKLKSENIRLNAATEILEEEARSQVNHLSSGPLAGVPISIKECYALAAKVIRSGSKRMKPIECKEDAAVVKKLKEAGAIIVARGNTSEFLLGRETNNLVFGKTNNPLNASLTTGGSTGGDGAMVGSGIVAIGIGTDIGGSVRYPGAFNGNVGFKPASGQIDKTGIFPVSSNPLGESMNSPGILSRSVRDARLVYNVLTGSNINASVNFPANILTCSTFEVEIKDDSIKTALDEGIKFLSANWPVSDTSIPESGKLFNYFNLLMFDGFRDNIYKWSTTSEGKKLSYFRELIGRWMGKKTVSDELFAVLFAFNLLKPGKSKIAGIMTEVERLRAHYYEVLKHSILVLPTLGILAPEHGKFYPQYNKPGIIKIITPVSFCNVLNLSCITIPAWKYRKDSQSSPPAIQLITAPGNEEMLLNVAERLESTQ